MTGESRKSETDRVERVGSMVRSSRKYVGWEDWREGVKVFALDNGLCIEFPKHSPRNRFSGGS